MSPASLDDYPLLPAVRQFLAAGPVQMLIGGRWLGAADGRTFPVFDPSTGSVIAQVAEGGPTEIDRAVQAGRAAFESSAWREMTPAARGQLLWRWTELIERDAELLGQIDTLNVGLPLDKTRGGEIPAVVGDLQYYAGWTTKLTGQTIPVSSPGLRAYTAREPVGVCGAIVPWNYPMEAVSGKLGPALACGNTVVLKPAEETPLSALWLARLAEEAGFPPGVINVVPGYGETAGAALAAHAGVDKIGFTGSTEVGRKIAAVGAARLKRVSLELGGKSPHVICADADLQAAVPAVVWGIFSHSGQNCIAGSRLLVEASVYDEVLARVIAAAGQVRVGPAFDPATQVGPLISVRQLERVLEYIKTGQQEGATLRLGGGRPANAPTGGYYLEPTVFTEVQDDMTIAREEIFGPVLSMLRFESWDELIRRANHTDYGLAAALWTRDNDRIEDFAQRVRAGIVWINGHNLYDSAVPFGGVKQSGYGRELGEASLDEYTQVKTVWRSFQPPRPTH